MAIFQMTIFQRSYRYGYISNGNVFHLSIYRGSFTLFCKEAIPSFLLPHLKMSRLYRLDSSSSSDDDDEPELTLGALHQAHRRYLSMHSSQWGGSVPGRQYIHRDRESGHWRLYHDYFQKLQHMMHLSFGAGM